MYTNIPTGPALEVVGTYIHNRYGEPAFANALMEALKIGGKQHCQI
jgi:hypothetical protein